jgi:hypothetical protein
VFNDYLILNTNLYLPLLSSPSELPSRMAVRLKGKHNVERFFRGSRPAVWVALAVLGSFGHVWQSFALHLEYSYKQKYHLDVDNLSYQAPSKSAVVLPRELSPSSQCLAQSNSTLFQTYCKEQATCQIADQKSQSLFSLNTANISHADDCKMLWINGISLGFPKSDDTKVADGGDGFRKEYAAALHSALQNANDSLQPMLIIMTPANMDQNATHIVSEYSQWAQSKGVIVVQVQQLSFQNLVYKHFPQYESDGRIAYYLRFDIPKILRQHGLLDKPGICRQHIFYTDSDVLFMKTIGKEHMTKLVQLLGDKPLMYGQDFLINRPKPSNTGVILMNVHGFEQEWPDILAWGERIKRGFPAHDQLWLNRFYAAPQKWKARNELLPPTWNWKVYWVAEPIDILEQVYLVHFHGPKPQNGVEEIRHCDINGTKELHEAYQPLVRHAMCCDLGRTANAVLEMYQTWKGQTVGSML